MVNPVAASTQIHLCTHFTYLKVITVIFNKTKKPDVYQSSEGQFSRALAFCDSTSVVNIFRVLMYVDAKTCRSSDIAQYRVLLISTIVSSVSLSLLMYHNILLIYKSKWNLAIEAVQELNFQ